MNTALDYQPPDELGFILLIGIIVVWALYTILRTR